ncbi:MAG: phenylalanine--tRNA ligase subunit beta [Bacteroides sp.]|nr:phenylalanine--tRNA ligase subunit beta [Roseburia sp.]MCM1461986.1 phenylalanine--tRNA ligase subunit beta [Bacteroides sp.]
MDLSMKWLGDYVKIDAPIKEFVEKMTMSGSKVETYEDTRGAVDKVVVGKVVALSRHENSDHLWVCRVDVGLGEPIQIVTGAQNVYEGAFIPTVLDGGTVIDRKEKTLQKIKKGKLRGAESNGMFCSFEELGLENAQVPYSSPDGVLVLNDDPDFAEMTVGEDAFKALGLDDVRVEFEITNNRPDCLSVLGLAREASATFDVPLGVKAPIFRGVDGDIRDELSVEVKNTKLCSRYMAAKVKNVKIAPSPRWMAERLRASGVRPINNLVDITNFVMLEYGHPMHAFDARYLRGNKIVVRNAEAGETIKLLDEAKEPIALSPEMLVICDEREPVAVAGVMGGEHSGIWDDTTEVIFEAACFDGVSVRRTAKKIGERTEASARFEKGIDPVNAKNALYRALELVEELGCGEVLRTVIDEDHSNKTPHRLKHDYQWVNDYLGSDIPEAEQIAILRRLGFEYDEAAKEITVPSVRIDMNLPCDIAEEVARIYGYNRIASTVPKLSSQGKITPAQRFADQTIEVMLSQGCLETMTFSFISPKGYEKLRFPEGRRKSVVLMNPLGEDTSVMRTSMLPSMTELIARNINNRNSAGRFFELGRIYLPKESADELPEERESLCIGLYGADESFFTLKGIAEELFDRLGVKVKFEKKVDDQTFHSGRCAIITSGDRVIGTLGELHPTAAEAYGVKERIYLAELDLETMRECAEGEREYRPLPRFPAISRDLSLVCDEEISSGELIELISGAASCLEQVTLFDLYRGTGIPEGKKSVSYKLIFRRADRTMEAEEADRAVEKILKKLAERDVTLR